MNALAIPAVMPIEPTPPRAWCTLEGAFARALIDPGQAVPDGLVDPDGRTSARRFGVYRNNVIASLIHALRDAYPVVARIVGEAFFEAMAIAFVRGHLPRMPVMLDYGAEFATFIDAFEPAAELPYLADVARLEWAWVEAYHAAEARPLDASGWQRISSRGADRLRLALHPSVRVVTSRYPILTIWRMNRDELPLAPMTLDAPGEDVLVVRPDAAVEMHRLPEAAPVFIATIGARGTLGDAAMQAMAASASFDVVQGLAVLVQSGACVALDADSQADQSSAGSAA